MVLTHPCCLQRPRSHSLGDGSSTGRSPQGSIHSGRCKELLGTRARKALGAGVADPRDRSLPSVPSLRPGGTALLPNLAAKANSDLVPLLKCQNLDKLLIFLQSAKSQWINHKTCSKGHILLALLFVCWPSSALSPALISGDLFLQPAQWVTCPRCRPSVLPLPFTVGQRWVPACRLRPRDSYPPRELPQSSFPAG